MFFPEGYCGIRGMLKFNTFPRLVNHSFAKSMCLKLFILGCLAVALQRHLGKLAKRCVRNVLVYRFL